jgi:hypothetical protein
MSTQCADCLDTGVLYPNGEGKTSLPCPYCPPNYIAEDEVTYHKSQIIASNPGTVVYWTECAGIASDIPHSDIPIGAKVIDETHNVGNNHAN